jgi:type VI protein secretion system component VasK
MEYLTYCSNKHYSINAVLLSLAVCLGFVLLTLWCLRRFLAKKREEKEKKKKKKPKGPVDLQVSGLRHKARVILQSPLGQDTGEHCTTYMYLSL